MTRAFEFALGEYYHLYNRGTDRRSIFLNNNDRDRFLTLLYLCNNQEIIHLSDYPKASLAELLQLPRAAPLLAIGAYCLMPNHFHLLVKEEVEGGISRFMQKFTTAYTMYVNKRWPRSGSLLESTFRAKHVDDDQWLRYLFAYIHLNPVKITDPENWEQKIIPDSEKALGFLRSYKYSSFLDHYGQTRVEGAIIDRTVFPEYFINGDDFSSFIRDWSEYEDDN